MDLKVVKQDYWHAIIDEYYDNIHWETDNPPSIYQWLKKDYGADTSLGAKFIHFTSEKNFTWFMLRWGESCEKLT